MPTNRLGIFAIPWRHEDWGQMAAFYKKRGVREVTLSVKDSQGMMFTPSTYVPSVLADGRSFARGVETLRAAGIVVHASFAVFNDFIAGSEDPNRLAVSADGARACPGGAWHDWRETNYWHLCPTRENNIARIVGIIDEFVQNYPVDGVDLDFIRFPYQNARSTGGAPRWFCYCDNCRSRFAADTSMEIPTDESAAPQDWATWMTWRAERIVEVVERVRAGVMSALPEAKLRPFIALYSTPGSTRANLVAAGERFGQDLGLLGPRVDALMPMLYHRFTEGMPVEHTQQPVFWLKNIVRQMRELSGTTVTGAVQGENPISPDELACAIGNAFNGGSTGIVVYPGFTWQLTPEKWHVLAEISRSLAASENCDPPSAVADEKESA